MAQNQNFIFVDLDIHRPVPSGFTDFLEPLNNYSMDKEEFQRKLNEVAEWQLPDVTATGEIKSPKRGRKTAEEQYQEEHEEVFLEMFDGKNPTMTPQLTKVKIAAVICPDCGIVCAEGRRCEIKYHMGNPKHVDHRRERCVECKMYRHPETGLFELPMGPAAQVYLNWAKRQYSLNLKQDPKEEK